jgi:hypothetical protein
VPGKDFEADTFILSQFRLAGQAMIVFAATLRDSFRLLPPAAFVASTELQVFCGRH